MPQPPEVRVWRTARLRGWRPSADRARLHAISLLSGNFTGNFAILRHLEKVLEQETAAPQSLFAQFPTQLTGKIFQRTRNFLQVSGNSGSRRYTILRAQVARCRTDRISCRADWSAVGSVSILCYPSGTSTFPLRREQEFIGLSRDRT